MGSATWKDLARIQSFYLESILSVVIYAAKSWHTFPKIIWQINLNILILQLLVGPKWTEQAN